MEAHVIEDYCRRSGDKSVPDGNLEENEHGFCVWRKEDNVFLIVAVYGDGKYWNNWCTEKTRELGMRQIIMATKRKPDAFVRKHGFKITGYVLARSV